MVTEDETNTETVEYIVLYDGHRTHLVPRPFYEDVRDRVVAFRAQMIPGLAYKSEIMYGADSWALLSDTQQRMAGRCIANMERNDLLPLRRLGCRHQYPARYALR